MSDNRKYYYLKLKENYFDDDSIVLLESMQDGVLYSNILLKLYLKSLKHGGRLQLDEDIPYTAQMIATITRQQIGTVERALQIFLKLGLVEVLDSGTFYMSNIELLIGQSSTEAERKRAARLQNKALSAPRTNGGHLSDIRPPEIEREMVLLGNMDSVVFLGGREASTIKEISENWLGKATISMQTEGRSRGQSESYNQNTQRLGRELMTPSELATMPGDKCILQLRGLPPFFSKKYDLKQHPNYRYTAEADKTKNAFDLDKLINRRRRPGLNEVCEVYEAAVSDDTLTAEDEDILSYDDIDDPDAFV